MAGSGAILIGNVLEWADFATYGYFAPVIGREFFPSTGLGRSLDSAFAVFALGFIGRVLGGYLFARRSARSGQRAALRTSILVMAISTAMIGCLPTFAQVGLAAPLSLIALRLVQGLSLGGEFTTSLSYVYLAGRPSRRGLLCGLVATAGTSGFLLSSALGAGLTAWLPQIELDRFGWRIPFWLGALTAVIVFQMRGRLGSGDDRVGYLRAMPGDRSGRGLAESARTISGCACYMFGFYLIFVYLPNGLELRAAFGMESALSLTSLALLLLAAVCPIAGIAADRFGSTRILITAAVSLAIVSIPLFHVISETRSADLVFLSMATLTVLFAPIHALTPLPLLGRTLRDERGLRFSVSFNVAGVGFGGLAPLAADLAATHGRGLDACGGLLALMAILSAPAFHAGRKSSSEAVPQMEERRLLG